MFNLKQISTTIIQVNHMLSIAKKDLNTYLADKSISLDERWKVFCNAPAAIKNHKTWIAHFEWEKKYGELPWFDNFHCERYSLVEMEQVV